jgi:hypothetical protein
MINWAFIHRTVLSTWGEAHPSDEREDAIIQNDRLSHILAVGKQSKTRLA